MGSDCYAAQLKVVISNKQICHAHLIRECEGLHEKYNSKWAIKPKSKLEHIIRFTQRQSIPRKTVERKEKELLSILKEIRRRAHQKVDVFRDRLYKICTNINTCLRNRLVPPTNYMSERALRGTKVKLAISVGPCQ